MGVSNGQNADETTFNDAFMDRLDDTSTIGKVDLLNAQPESGNDVLNLQREINSLNSFTGRIAGSAFDVTPIWVNNDIGSSTDSVKQRADLITERFNGTSGHSHSGDPGEGPMIDYLGINAPLQGFVTQGDDLTGVTGGTHDVSTELMTKEVSTSSIELGVPSTAPYNKVFIRETVSNDPVEDGSGNQVYGRLTNSGGVGGTWTLTFYSDVAGVETAYTAFSSDDISWWYQELFHPLDPARPVYSEEFFVPSDNATQDVVDATQIQAGKVSTAAQVFGGEKAFAHGFATPGNDVASTATIAALVNTGSFTRITGTTVTQIQGVAAPASGRSKRLIISNVTNQIVTLAHEHGSATASNRIFTFDAEDIELQPNQQVELIYDIVQTRWLVSSSGGGGSGGGEYVVTGTEGAPEDITVLGGITVLGEPREMIFIQGDGGPVDVSANPQISAGLSPGNELLLVGRSNDNTVTLFDGTGLKLNGSITLAAYTTLKLVWTGTLWLEQSRSA